MLLVAALCVAFVTVPLAGGRLAALADVEVRRLWALLTALVLQLGVMVFFAGAHPGLLALGHLASYVAAGVFVFSNRHVPGWWLIGLGGLMNFVAIGANAGVMPASEVAVATAGLADVPGRFANSAVVVDPNLAWLGDIFAVPADWPLANVFSAGDICLAAGGAVAVHGVCRSRLGAIGAGEFTGLFVHRGFVRLWASQAVSNIGDWAYALAVATALVRRAEAPQALAFLLIAQVGPAALAGLLGGPCLDRLSRRGLMVALDLVRAFAVASLLLSNEPSLPHLYAVAACLGMCEALFQPSVHASIPELVPRRRIVAANALVSGTFNVAVMAGPVLGGVLVAALGLEPVLVLNAATFVVSAALLSKVALRKPAHPPPSSPLEDLRAGLRYTFTSPLVRAVFVVTGLVMLAAAVRSPLEPLFVLDTLGLRPQALGLLGGAWGLGMVLGAAAAPAAARRWSRARLLAVGIVAVGASALGASQASALSSLLALWLLSGAGNALGTVCYESLLQEFTPDSVRGRVLSASEAVLNAAFLAGASLSGWLAAGAGVRAAFAVSGAVFLVAASASLVLLNEPAKGAAVARGAGTVPSAP